jgi:hypothetical protein
VKIMGAQEHKAMANDRSGGRCASMGLDLEP